MGGVAWGEGAVIPGTPFREVVPGTATDGHAVLLTVDMPPGLHVDAHVHAAEDQINVVVSGRVHFRVGEETCELGAGGVLLMPRNIEHELWNEGPDFAQIIEIYTPPGIETMFAAAGAAVKGDDLAGSDDYAAARGAR
jgi:quercetin dioxygenase-like cupin family protein